VTVAAAPPQTLPSEKTDDQPLIQIAGVRKRYGSKWVLKGVNLTVAKGETVALLGANGAGKSTLMRIVAGLSQPDRGEVHLGGVSTKRAGHELRRYIGLVGHAPLLYDGLSGLENMNFFAGMYDILNPEARIESVLREVDLWLRRVDAVRTYSRGMTQRLAIARAILHDPPVLLLDEPDTGLDQASVDMLQGLIQQLGSANRAVLLTTHNLERALAWSDRICMLAGGEIVVDQRSAELDAAGLRTLYREVVG
jgi:ABC-type multidrug transport system ATPase subunit